MRRRALSLLAAAAVGVVVGITATFWWPAPVERVLAQATLDALPGWTARGEASVARSASGLREVTVTLATGDNPATDAPLREVWLLTADTAGLVSLGLLAGESGRFPIPATLDLGEFPIVDVSAEPSDGDPAHSGASIVRGLLVPSDRAS